MHVERQEAEADKPREVDVEEVEVQSSLDKAGNE